MLRPDGAFGARSQDQAAIQFFRHFDLSRELVARHNGDQISVLYALIAHLALADERGYRIMADERRRAIHHARRITARLDAAP